MKEVTEQRLVIFLSFVKKIFSKFYLIKKPLFYTENKNKKSEIKCYQTGLKI